MKTSDFPVWLAVPYELREEARKDAGSLADGRAAIEWDSNEKLFFARPGCDLERIGNWLPDKTRRAGGGNPEQEFLDVLTEAGLKVQGMPIMNGSRQRVATIEDKSGKKSGVYCGYDDRRPAGWFINYHRAASDKEVTNWKASGGEADPETRLHLRAAARQSQDDVERERAQLHATQTAAAQRLYGRLPAVDPEHPYLVRKGITPTDELRQTNTGSMVVPFYSVEGEFKTLQYIPVTGDKILYKDAPKQGSFLVVGGELSQGQPILYAEGYATARSLNMATGHPVVMTIDAGNMLAVSAILHKAYPGSPHLFLADFDHAKKENKGLIVATAAAERVGGTVVYPDFTAEEKALGLTDFNDIHTSRGLAAVLSQVSPALNKLIEELPMQDDPKPETPAAPELPASPEAEAQVSPGTWAPQYPLKPASPANENNEAPVASTGIDNSDQGADLPGTNAARREPQIGVLPNDFSEFEPKVGDLPPEFSPAVSAESVSIQPPSVPDTAIPFVAQDAGLGGELTVEERDQLRSHGWTDDQLTDIPADQARSALASYATSSETPAVATPQPDVTTDSENVESSVVPPIDVQPGPLQEDVAPIPADETDLQSRRPAASDSDGAAEQASEVDAIWVGPRRGVDEALPPSDLIDKDSLLARLDSVVQEDKSVLYKLDGEPAFVDRGMRLEMAAGASQSDEKVLAALLTAAEFYRGRLELTGSEAFQSKAIGLIARYQPNVTMKNPAQQKLLAEARKALQIDPAMKDAIHGDQPGAPDAQHEPSAEGRAAPAVADLTGSNGQHLMQMSAQEFAADKGATPHTPSVDPAATPKVASEIHESHLKAAKGVVGKVIAFGDAPFRFQEGNTQSTYIKLRTQEGMQTYWGKELAGLLRDTRVTQGNVVTLQWLGKEAVVVQVPIKDDNGNVKRYEAKEAHRNQWSLTMMGGATVRTGQDEGVKLAAYDANRFAHVQQALLARLRLDLPLPEAPKDGLYWLTPDGQGSSKTGDPLSASRPPEDHRFAAQPVMSSWSPDGHLDMALVRGDGPYLQGVVRQNGQFQHVLVSLPGKDDAPPMIFNAPSPAGLVPIGSGNGINQSGGQAVSRENIAFKIDGDSAVRIGKLDTPAELPPALHARLGFDERWRDDNTLPKSAPAAAPTAQPSEPRPA